MAIYDGEAAVYDELGAVLRTLLASDERRAALQQADCVFQFALTEPAATITCLARAGAPAAVGTGQTDVPADLVFAMQADTARALLFGERSPLTMLSGGEIALKGPARKLLMVLTALVGASEVQATPDAPAEPSADSRGEPGEVEAGEEAAVDDRPGEPDAPDEPEQPGDAAAPAEGGEPAETTEPDAGDQSS